MLGSWFLVSNELWFKILGTDIVLNFVDKKILKNISYKDKQNYIICNMLNEQQIISFNQYVFFRIENPRIKILNKRHEYDGTGE